ILLEHLRIALTQKLLAAAGEGAISAGRTEPHRDCSVAVSGGLGAYKMNKHSALRAGIFKALGSTDPMGVMPSAEARAWGVWFRCGCARQVIPQQWLHPCSATPPRTGRPQPNPGPEPETPAAGGENENTGETRAAS